MLDSCYNIVIRQNTCENGISRVYNNTYTNVEAGVDIPLQFGYTLRYLQGNTNYATVQFINNFFMPATNFNIPNGSYRVFDLPCECGTFRIFVGVTTGNCSISSLVCAD